MSDSRQTHRQQVRIGHRARLCLEDVAAAAFGAPVVLDPETEGLLDARRAEIVASLTASGEPAYGFNRGFGHNVDVGVPEARLEALQRNLVRSHAAGVGEPMPRAVVRAAMLLRAHSLAQGNSGVRSVVVRRLVEWLNAGVTPAVPVYGSVGASGDLAPLAHVALALLGEGEVLVDSGAGAPGTQPAGDVLAAAGLAPLELEMKEGLALLNGVQISTAYGVLACLQLESLLRTAAVTTALSAQVQLGSDTPFLDALHALRPHPGAREVARWIWALMRHSPMRGAHERHAVDWEVQDPYSLRCAAQILGACWELVAEARATLEIEANSVTDNPLLLPDASGAFTRVISGGHFHGMPVAVRLYGLLQCCAVLAHLSNTRCARYVDEDRNKGLGADLIWSGLSPDDRASSSGLMIPEYVSAALTNAIWGRLVPSHLLSIPTDAGQEDHVSMSAGLAVRLWETLPLVARTLAVELVFASQATAIRQAAPAITTKRALSAAELEATAGAREAYAEAVRSAVGDASAEVDIEVRQRHRWSEAERALSPPCAAVVDVVREIVPVVVEDRPLGRQLDLLAERVADGSVLAAIGSALDPAATMDGPTGGASHA